MASGEGFELDPRRVRRAFNRAARTYDRSAGVQSEIRSRLLERLDLIRLQPTAVVDLGAGTGTGARLLKDRYRTAQVVALDSSPGMLKRASARQGWLRPFRVVGGDAAAMPLKDASAELVVSNLMLEWCADPDTVFGEVRRVLKPGGLFTFTTLGPDTLKELRDATTRAWNDAQIHRFIDMHDLGDALMRAGFADPVMDTETLTVTFSSLRTLMRELKDTGAVPHRPIRPGLMGRKRFQALEDRFQPEAAPHRFTVEVVYGHAWASNRAAPRRTQGDIAIPVSAISRRKV
jgi:malonyl-CoA O-methyltransferase